MLRRCKIGWKITLFLHAFASLFLLKFFRLFLYKILSHQSFTRNNQPLIPHLFPLLRVYFTSSFISDHIFYSSNSFLNNFVDQNSHKEHFTPAFPLTVCFESIRQARITLLSKQNLQIGISMIKPWRKT